jgi:DNA-binding FadR family transcriptional regulator
VDHQAMTSVPTSLLRPVRDGNAFETAVERLVRTIKLGVIADGEKLPPERDLAKALQVGRTTLREALEALRQAGYVETRRGRGGGTFVSYAGRPGAGDAAEIARSMGAQLHDALDFRRVVEPGAAELAATRDLSAADRVALEAALEACSSAAHDRARRGADSRLHLTVEGLAGSDLLLASVVDVQLRVGELLAAIPVLRRNIAHSDRQHAEIVDAILAGAPVRARRAMEAHCDGTSALLRGFLT